ncbi:hypothetical protein LJR029_006493 [Caballeronia sp. LjRoot29]|uniref:hypothetical protein n=1 Tax=Caballeronia sp. LjRoot29 TaxID=3342315 RepID=UPI003ECE23D9
MRGVGDKAFVQDLQKAADWLAARSVLPQKINVSDYCEGLMRHLSSRFVPPMLET